MLFTPLMRSRLVFSLILGILMMFALYHKQGIAEQAPVYDIENASSDEDDWEEDEPLQAAPAPPSALHEDKKPAHSDSAADYSVKKNSDDEETPLIMSHKEDTGTRILHLEQQTGHSYLDAVLSQIETLRGEVQTLRGQVEQLSHQLDQLRDQEKTAYIDLDKRVTTFANQLSTKATPASTTTAQNETPAKPLTSTISSSSSNTNTEWDAVNQDKTQPDTLEEQQIYQTAYNFIKNKKYNEAAKSLQRMLAKYPTGSFSANAHYWLGELYGLMGQNDRALVEFNVIINHYPNGSRVPDALLKKGLIYATQSKWADAKLLFKEVIHHYSGTTAAHIASEQLKQIKQIHR